mgnify:CR=1 FL=1
MALSPQLLQFKSSGVYRLEFDKSQVSSISAETIRLVAGHSRKGPYNTPVYIEDTDTFQLIFGGIDKKLEKKGMFFHRSCFEALKRGPILAMNLALFDSQDTAAYTSLVTDGSDDTAATALATANYADFHNTDKFMFPEDAALLDVAGNLPTSNTALNFVNLGQDPLTVIVRQAQETGGFDVTCREFYGQGKCPEGTDEMDYVSDYMVDIFVFKGKFEAAVLDTDPVYGDYFTATGLKKDKLVDFANERTVDLVAQYTGSIIPNFQDLEGNGIYIEQIVNAETRKTGLFCAVNEEAIEEGNADLVGHKYDNTKDYELLSYDLGVGASATTYDLNGTFGVTASGATIVAASGSITINDDTDHSAAFAAGDFVKLADGSFEEIINVTFTAAAAGAPAGTLGTTVISFTSPSTPVVSNTNFQIYLEETQVQGSREIDTDTLVLGAVSGSSVTVTDPSNSGMMLEVGDYLPTGVTGALARIEKIAKNGLTGEFTISCNRAIDTNYDPQADFGLKSFHKAATEYKVTNLDPIVISTQSIQDCLNAFSSGGVKAALVDRDIIDLRYIVDTFGSFEGGNLLNKSEFTKVAKERQNVSCILNAPTVAEFKKSTDPSFKDAFEGKFDTRFIPTGGDLSQNPAGTFALPSIGDGANYGFYYTPGLQIRENGKITTVPPAAYVSNNYIDKFTDALPWSIVAGPRRGIVSGTNLIGAEYAFDKTDRDNIEPFGLNPIVFERGVGLNIKGNKTGQQVIKSALSSAHVREVLIFIENGLADILKGYMFEFNTAQTRLEIKTLADSFMEGVLADNGVFAYKNVMDSTNNTNEVIDNNMGILDTYVEPVKGLEIIVHRTTVLNTGEIASGGY